MNWIVEFTYASLDKCAEKSESKKVIWEKWAKKSESGPRKFESRKVSWEMYAEKSELRKVNWDTWVKKNVLWKSLCREVTGDTLAKISLLRYASKLSDIRWATLFAIGQWR